MVTGFGPFGRIRNNPSMTLARGCGRPHFLLDVTFDAVETFLKDGFDSASYDALLLVGVADSRRKMSLERVARNLSGATKDVSGQLLNGPIDDNGPTTLPSSLWTSECVEHPDFEWSDDAGDYLCNYALYRALQSFPDHRVGFLHVPTRHKLTLRRQAENLGWLLNTLER